MLSTKNKLQEYCQKNRISFPEYDTKRPENSATGWISSLKLVNNSAVSSVFNRKSDAEKDVAEKMLELLKENQDVKVEEKQYEISLHDISVMCCSVDTICLIDVENIPKSLSLSPHSIPNNLLVIGIAGYRSSYAEKNFPFNKHIIRSAGKNASDYMISFLVGYIVGTLSEQHVYESNHTHRFILVSKDHYVETMKTCLQQQGYKCEIAVSVNEMISLLIK